MIQSFRNRGTEDLFDGASTKAARKTLPQTLWDVAYRKLDHLQRAEVLEDLRRPPGNRLEALRGARRGQHSIRINQQYRVCFTWTPQGPEDVEVTDYH